MIFMATVICSLEKDGATASNGLEQREIVFGGEGHLGTSLFVWAGVHPPPRARWSFWEGWPTPSGVEFITYYTKVQLNMVKLR